MIGVVGFMVVEGVVLVEEVLDVVEEDEFVEYTWAL